MAGDGPSKDSDEQLDHQTIISKPKESPLDVLLNKFLTYIRSQDTFGKGAAPFNLGGKGKANSVPGGIISSFIKYLAYIFLILKINEMMFFSKPAITQLTIQGTPLELSTVYDKKRLGNTSFAIQIK